MFVSAGKNSNLEISEDAMKRAKSVIGNLFDDFPPEQRDEPPAAPSFSGFTSGSSKALPPLSSEALELGRQMFSADTFTPTIPSAPVVPVPRAPYTPQAARTSSFQSSAKTPVGNNHLEKRKQDQTSLPSAMRRRVMPYPGTPVTPVPEMKPETPRSTPTLRMKPRLTKYPDATYNSSLSRALMLTASPARV
jgi:hypothetical protein